MLKVFKYGLVTLITLILCVSAIIYTFLTLSLPDLDGTLTTKGIKATTSLSRDSMGHAVIEAKSLEDVAYALGVAHAQDRLFQMDTQRRTASGRLSEIIGAATLEMDKSARFYSFEKWAKINFDNLPVEQQTILKRYAQGVNETVESTTTRPFEYYLLRQHFAPWKPTDSLLVLYSMYMELQAGQVARDLAFTRIAHHFGQEMVDFMLKPSVFQAALDGSTVEDTTTIPELPGEFLNDQEVTRSVLLPLPDVGSNNWAVAGTLTNSQSAMVANDMHLGLRVPIIWYRAQLNYTRNNKPVQLTGVSLPGLPGIVVGTNGHIAWGFTNANLDNTDWIALDYMSETTRQVEPIHTANGNVEGHSTMQHAFGPVKEIGQERYALKWVALTEYGANLNILELDQVTSVNEALNLAPTFGMPVQNFTVVDASGNVGWSPAGAVTARRTPSNTAISSDNVDALWQKPETNLPRVLNPRDGRIWTANARVISAQDLARFGDGGYAVGARGEQIRDRLFEQNEFDEAQFLSIQLDNEARFLSRWHQLLISTLEQDSENYQDVLTHLRDWQACACADSVGYTLVDRFRTRVVSDLFVPVADILKQEDVSFRPVIRHLEPAAWALIQEQPESWLPKRYANYDEYLQSQFDNALQQLWVETAQNESNTKNWSQLTWGRINALQVRHPLSRVLPVLSDFLDMPKVDGYGDSYMPAVQAPSFGASQRFFARPGELDKAVLTLPGGQSGHPLSPFYRTGFEDYATNSMTPLLPDELQYTLTIEPVSPPFSP